MALFQSHPAPSRSIELVQGNCLSSLDAIHKSVAAAEQVVSPVIRVKGWGSTLPVFIGKRRMRQESKLAS